MELLLTLAVTAALILVIQVLWLPPSWLRPVRDRLVRWERERDGGQQPPATTAADGQPGEGGSDPTVEWGLFTYPFIRDRLDALAEELQRLDRDRDIFAKAFHTMVARSAYEALLVDASRLSEQPRRQTGQILDFELVGPSTRGREELEL